MRPLWLHPFRWLTWFHRWGGVVLCVFFALWFASGAIVHFVGFPSLSPQERRAAGNSVDLSTVAISPATALSKRPGATDLRLVMRADRGAYLVQEPDERWIAIDATTGSFLPDLPGDRVRGIAERFARSTALDVSGPFDYDQWIVHQHFDPYRPFYRIRLDDADHTDLYVSAATGEVLQRTRRSERLWNWAGTVIHWTYFTPLRKSWNAWNQVVWWLSLIALVSTLAGTWLGIVRMMANRLTRRQGLSPFRGWLRWHHILGLFSSAIVITWMLSGWLSMDHGRLFSVGHASQSQLSSLSGATASSIADAAALPLLHALGSAVEVAFNAIDGRPFATVYRAEGSSPQDYFLGQPLLPMAAIPDALLLSGIHRVWPAARAAPGSGGVDGFYRRAESAGTQAAGFVAGSDDSIRAYVDPVSARFVAVMDSSRRGYAWIYYGLHTWNFPGLSEHPLTRSVLVLSLLALGFAASVTGVVLGVKRLQRTFASTVCLRRAND